MSYKLSAVDRRLLDAWVANEFIPGRNAERIADEMEEWLGGQDPDDREYFLNKGWRRIFEESGIGEDEEEDETHNLDLFGDDDDDDDTDYGDDEDDEG